ncbi:VOC family protein [Staphylospora marina]|uniref:VOC family protein n=1 Tax=Staphylospora marina TaxID=2490858 RepID=UPI0013DDD8B5|nr:VOC family protein [Staphylospora marina]
MKTRLMHVRANVSDLQRAIRWYEEVLGFKVTDVWPPEKPNYAHFSSEEGAIFAIMEDENVPSHGRFNFSVSDVDALWERLKDRAEVVEELFDTPYGSRKFTIRDLDGNELGFVKG